MCLYGESAFNTLMTPLTFVLIFKRRYLLKDNNNKKKKRHQFILLLSL